MPLTYAAARRGYLEWFEHLLSPVDADTDAEVLSLLADRVDGFTYAAQEFAAMTIPHLQAGEDSLRSAALDSLLNQVEGDLAAANFLWDIIGESESADLTESIKRPSTRSHNLMMTVRRLATEIPPSLEDAAATYQIAPRRAAGVTNRDNAVADLQAEIEDTIDLITERTNTIGMRLIRDILSIGNTEWRAVLAAVDLLQGNQKVGNVGWGLEDIVPRGAMSLAGVLREVLVNIVQKLLAIIEKNDLVRYTIAEWLEDIHETPSENRKGKFTTLLDQLYQAQYFREHTLPVWLGDALDPASILEASGRVRAIGDNFDRLSLGISQVENIVNAAGLFGNPTLKSVGLSLQVALLCTLIFAGYDHLDEGARGLNIAAGVKQVLIETLPVTRRTIELADNLQRRTVRIR